LGDALEQGSPEQSGAPRDKNAFVGRHDEIIGYLHGNTHARATFTDARYIRRMIAHLPRFDLDEYSALLKALDEVGYRFALVAELPRLTGEHHVLLRHDVDLDPPSVIAMAEREAALEIQATYYVPLTQHFNVLSLAHRDAIRALVELGHEIGLHMRTYPSMQAKALDHLQRELDILSAVSEAPVRTLCMHQPHRGHSDPFRSLPGLVHPHDPQLQEGLVYVSDSCRAWRDNSLLSAFSAQRARRMLLNLHPELWLEGSVEDPFEYLADTLAPIVESRARSFLQEEQQAWSKHETARAVR
jgi:hypothetical protein